MSDVYVPGIQSRFKSEKMVEDLMKIERIPRDRTQKNIDDLAIRKTWWQDLGTHIGSMRESSRMLFSFQNPFNERVATSSNEHIISATASREAVEQEYRFSVKQLAQADRFLSSPLDEKTKIEAGTYTFSVGQDEISFNFKGGTLKEFTDILNRHGQKKIGASLLTVQPGTRSLLVESKMTGAGNRLGFSGEAANLAARFGMAEEVADTRREIDFGENTVRSLSSASVPLNLQVDPKSTLVLKIGTATKLYEETEPSQPAVPPPGPDVPSSGFAAYGNIVIENSPSTAPLPEFTPPAPRVDNLSVLSLNFSDGSKAALPPITDTEDLFSRQYKLSDIAGGKTITAINIDNTNTHRDIVLGGAEVFDPEAIPGTYKPLRAVSTAQDAIVAMEGIEMTRPANNITDIIPGVTVTLRGVSDRPERLEIRPDRERVKDAIFTLVGNYNRLMAELNILTRSDPRLIEEITYFDKEEADEMRLRLGVFSGETSVNQFRTNLLRTVTSPYPTDMGQDLSMLAQIGIGTNTSGSIGASYNPSQLRGYLEIDQKVLENALEQNLPAVKQLFGFDTTGDMLVDTGVAFNLDAVALPFVERGGIISLKTGSIDSRISQDQRRIDTMDRQLARKEAELSIQYSRMESAYSRMEQMSSSLDNFSRQNSNNR